MSYTPDVIVAPTAEAVHTAIAQRSIVRELLEWNTLDMAHWYDDFLNAALVDTTAYSTYISGTGAVALALLADQRNGVARLDAGTDSGGFSAISGELNFRGDNSCVIAVRLALNDIANVKCEVGFKDATSSAAVVNVLATPSATATDGAVWIVDRNDTANWQGVSVDSGTLPTTQEPSASAQIGPTAATFETMIVALQEYDATAATASARYLRLDAAGDLTYDSDWISAAISSNVLLTPWVLVLNRNATQHRADIDFIHVWQRRS